jgi:hypothetical protein
VSRVSKTEALTAVAAMRVKRRAVTFIVKRVLYIEKVCSFEAVECLDGLMSKSTSFLRICRCIYIFVTDAKSSCLFLENATTTSRCQQPVPRLR